MTAAITLLIKIVHSLQTAQNVRGLTLLMTQTLGILAMQGADVIQMEIQAQLQLVNSQALPLRWMELTLSCMFSILNIGLKQKYLMEQKLVFQMVQR